MWVEVKGERDQLYIRINHVRIYIKDIGNQFSVKGLQIWMGGKLEWFPIPKKT